MKIYMIFLLAVSGLVLQPSLLSSEKCDIVYFREPDCVDCADVESRVIPTLRKKYGGRIEIHRRDVGVTENFEDMMGFELKYSIKPQEVPELYTAFGVTWKPGNIKAELDALIEKELSSDAPGPHAGFISAYLETGETGMSVTEIVKRQYFAKKKLTVYEFRKPGCKSCSRVSISLRYIQKKYPEHVRLVTLDIKENKAKILNEALCRKYNVAADLRLATPAVFFGEHAYAGEKALSETDLVESVVKGLGKANLHPTAEISGEELIAAEKAILKRFDTISWAAVLGAGLLDGLNPCAFATIIFLLSYLAALEYKRYEAGIVGICFTVTVFCTYLLIGLGFLKFVDSLRNLSYVTDAVYFLAIGSAALVGMLNLIDAFRIHRGSLKDMSMKLPETFRRKINAVIRKNVRLRHYLIGAILIGFLVSILELACTGQVYLPTVLFIISMRGPDLRAVSMLAAYNAAFILPLVVVFVLFWFGTTDKKLTAWMQKRGGLVKMATGLLFLGLAVFLLLTKM